MHLCETAYSRLYKAPETPKLRARLSLIPLVLLVLSEEEMVRCIVDFDRGGSRNHGGNGGHPELPRIRELSTEGK